MLDEVTCPNCGKEVKYLNNIEAGMRLALEMAGQKDLPDAVCEDCFKEKKGEISEGVRLRADQMAAKENLEIVWAERITRVKEARQQMKDTNYVDALLGYESYLRTVENTFGISAGHLIPEKVDLPDKSTECTVITSVLWDLLQIYDMHPEYHNKMRETLKKLKLFLPYSNIYNKVVRHAHKYHKEAKRPELFTELLRNSKSQRGACFVATAAFESAPHYTVFRLRQWRDEDLKKTRMGRKFIYYYYKKSPRFAQFLSQNELLKKITRQVLNILVRCLDCRR